MNMRRFSLLLTLGVLLALGIPALAQEAEPTKPATTSLDHSPTLTEKAGKERTMSLTERLWRANYNPDRLPEQLRNLAYTAPGSGERLEALAKSAVDEVNPLDQYWVNILPSETDDDVFALDVDGNQVYAGGAFKNFVGIEANGIALWNGNAWTPIVEDGTIGVDGFVFALAVSGTKVYVGGQFTRVGNTPANNIAIWDKTTKRWSTMGEGITGDGVDVPFVSTIKVDGDNVYVGGQFTKAGTVGANNIARWNNGTWSAIGGGINGIVNTLEVFQNDLYVGGGFSGAGDISSTGIIRWDGTDWQDLAGGVVGYVNEIKVSGDTGIVVGGSFTVLTGGGEIARNIAWWSGSWIHRGGRDPFGAPGQEITIAGEVRSIVVDGRDMWVGGVFDDAHPREAGAGTGPLNNVVLFNDQPATWFRLPEGVNGPVNALAKTRHLLFAGGSFTRSGSLEANKIARWDTTQRRWLSVEPPAALAPIRAMTMHKGKLYAAGTFEQEKPGVFNAVNHLAELTTEGWQLIRGDIRGNIYSLTSAGDELVIGGSFITSDGEITVNTARWNDGTKEWHPLTEGSGVASLEDISYVTTMLADGDEIYIGGLFSIADTMTARNIAVWNRQTQQWRTLGEGVNGKIWALAKDPQGGLYAGGEFTASGNTTVNGVARWDGTSWQALGDGILGKVSSLLYAEGKLYAGGTFQKAGSAEALNVALWDPTTQMWSQLGAGLHADFQPIVNALTYHAGKVFAGGKFERSGLDSISNIAWWNPAGWWTNMGSGVDRTVEAMAVDQAQNGLYVGGQFFLAGRKNSPYTALWRDPVLTVEIESGPVAGTMLMPGTPNPFTENSTVQLHLPEGKNREVSLILCDAAGRTLRTLLNGRLEEGDHTIRIEGNDLPSGVYFLRLQSGDRIESVPLIRQ